MLLPVLMTAKLGLELLICAQLVAGTMIPGALHHHAMDGVILVVLCIILLPPGEDIIQGQLPLLFINLV